jgi:hypothetical protein
MKSILNPEMVPIPPRYGEEPFNLVVRKSFTQRFGWDTNNNFIGGYVFRDHGT